MAGHVVCGWASKLDPGVDDLERRVGDLEIDVHVVHRQRFVVVGEVQPRRLLVAHRAADEQPVVGEAVRADPVLAVVEDVEAVRVGRDDGVGAEHAAMSYPPARRCVDPGYRPRHRPVHAARAARRAGPARPEHAAELAAAAGGDRSTYGYTEVPAPREAHAADYIEPPARRARRRRGGPVRPAPGRRRAARRVHPLHGAAPVAWPRRTGRGGDRRDVARRRRPARPDQHRGQAAAARATPSTCGV